MNLKYPQEFLFSIENHLSATYRKLFLNLVHFPVRKVRA